MSVSLDVGLMEEGGVVAAVSISLFLDEVQFAVWVLMKDGLSVPPFNAHGPGDLSFSAAGLTGADWLMWLRTMVEAHSSPWPAPNQSGRHVSARIGNPMDFWPGPTHTRTRLALAWQEYNDAKKLAMRNLLQERRRMIQRAMVDPSSLQRDLPAPREATELLYSVAYPKIIYHPVAPWAVIMSDLGHNLDDGSYLIMLREAVRSLRTGAWPANHSKA
jgi:hypothetical protein